MRQTPQITAADGVDTTFFGLRHGPMARASRTSSAPAPPRRMPRPSPPWCCRRPGGPGSLAPHKLYSNHRRTATPLPVPNMRWIAGGFAGPVAFSANADWVRFTSNFSLARIVPQQRKVAAITFDTPSDGLSWSANPNRFSVSNARSGLTDMTWTTSPERRSSPSRSPRGHSRAATPLTSACRCSPGSRDQPRKTRTASVACG